MVFAIRGKDGLPLARWLHNGDCLSQKRFHRLYRKEPEGFRAELVNGVVLVSEPVGVDHADCDIRLGTLLNLYRLKTPGTYCGHNVTVILGDEDEMQPDVVLRILPEHGGQTRDVKSKSEKNKDMKFIGGAPELVAEVAFSSVSLDLHLKRRRYALAGVCEYLVLCLDPKRLYWFDLQSDKEVLPDADKIIRSKAFPGLFIHTEALIQQDCDLAIEVLNKGLKSAEHRAFVKRLAAAKHI